MATDSVIVPFHDPFDENPSIDQWDFFVEPTLEPPPNGEQDCFNYADRQSGHDSDDPLSDPFLWAFCNESDFDLTENSEGGRSRFPGECSNHGTKPSCENPISDDNLMNLSIFSVSRLQKNCNCCQKLREITHTDGITVKRLEIHGRFGIITHAVLEKDEFDSSFENRELQMFDFHNQSILSVKQFLVKYLDICKQEGYVMLHDPLLNFYEALCVGLNNNNDDNSDNFTRLLPENTGYFPDNKQVMLNQVGDIKIPLAVQRARTGNFKLKDFIDYFEFPIEEAARKMNICPTVMKKICRRNGVSRWPYRKIRSIKRKISKKTEILKTSNYEEKTKAVADLEKYQRELADIYAAFAQ